MPVTLNKLGEPDTLIEVIVTAEDGKTQETYKISIHRPYGTIKGNIKYDTIEENENPDIDKTTDLNIYKTGKFNWDGLKDIFGEIYENPKTYDDLDQIEKDQYEQILSPDQSAYTYILRTLPLKDRLNFVRNTILIIQFFSFSFPFSIFFNFTLSLKLPLSFLYT
mgnify:CR=1 FL=1